MVHILNPALVCQLLTQPPRSLAWGRRKTCWETEARVWEPERKSQKLLSPALSEEGNRMPENPAQMPPPPRPAGLLGLGVHRRDGGEGLEGVAAPREMGWELPGRRQNCICSDQTESS